MALPIEVNSCGKRAKVEALHGRRARKCWRVMGALFASALSVVALPACSSTVMPPVFAHQGGGEVAAKETLTAFVDAAAAGFALEFDVRKLSDGTLVIAHEAEAVDATGVRRPVAQFDAASWRNACLMVATPEGLRKPEPCIVPTTLKDVLEAIPRETRLAPELKANDVSPRELKRALEELGADGRSVVQSFDLTVATEVAAAGLTAMYVLDFNVDHDFEDIARRGISLVGVSKAYPVSIVQEAGAHGVKVMPWTVDDRAAAEVWRKAGAVSVISNVPHQIVGGSGES